MFVDGAADGGGGIISSCLELEACQGLKIVSVDQRIQDIAVKRGQLFGNQNVKVDSS